MEYGVCDIEYSVLVCSGDSGIRYGNRQARHPDNSPLWK